MDDKSKLNAVEAVARVIGEGSRGGCEVVAYHKVYAVTEERAARLAAEILALPQIAVKDTLAEALRVIDPVTAQAIVIACSQRVEKTDRTRDKPLAIKAFEAATRIADALARLQPEGGE